MEKQKIEIGTLPVTIRVVEVDGKRMTKPLFNQIPESEFLDIPNNFEPHEGTHYLGWVNTGKEKAIIFTYDNVLYKETFEEASVDEDVIHILKIHQKFKDQSNKGLKNLYIRAKKMYDDECVLTKEWNDAYKKYLHESQQLYIEI